MPTYLFVRHADAGVRSKWEGDDKLRPLSETGQKQAAKMAKYLKDYDILEVRSSPATRCVQTAAPIAEIAGLKVIVDADLFEGGEFDLPPGKGVHVICAHGDNIPGMLDRLRVSWKKCAKGSCWHVKVNDKGELKDAEYIEPQA